MIDSVGTFPEWFLLLDQALVGFEKTIKHLDGHLVDISPKVSMNMCFGTSFAMTKKRIEVLKFS